MIFFPLIMVGICIGLYFLGESLGKKRTEIPNIINLIGMIGIIYFLFLFVLSCFVAGPLVYGFFAYLLALVLVG